MGGWRILTLAYLTAATTIGIVTATNNEETGVSADGEVEVAEIPFETVETPDEYSNDTDASLRMSNTIRLNIKNPPPIQKTRSPRSDPCGTPTVQCLCPNSPYRTMDGTCNNLIFTARGSAGSAFSRLQRGRYANANGKVITKTAHGPLPLPRVLSVVLFEDRDVPDRKATNAMVGWGQMVAHDISFFQEDDKGADGKPIQCCTQDRQMLDNLHPKCFPIRIPRNDSFYSQFNVRCLQMKRSVILDTTGCGSSDIFQISEATHYLDLSNAYGNSDADAERLRSHVKGKLKAKVLTGALGRRDFLPQVPNPVQSCFVNSNKGVCYDSADFRVNQNLGIVVFQTIILREHNRIAKILSKMHPHWNDETLFQEARRINIAQYQSITYNEFLPVLIGKELMERLRLESPKSGFTNFYSPRLDVSTMTEFTTSAYRGLHGLIPEHYDLTDEERCPFSKILIKDIFANPGVIEKKDNFDALTRGLATQACQAHDPFFTKGVTRFLLKPPGLPFGGDLESFDIQRGRDHGLPTYNDMRHHCGLPRAKRFSDLLDLIPEKYVKRLKSLYHHVDDIEFFVGGNLERRGVLGDFDSLLGETFGCVTGEQFWRWKLADRYFFDLKGQAGSFTLEQINGIKKTSLAALLCENLSIKKIQSNPFLQVSKRNKLKLCKDVQRMDLSGFLNYSPNDSCEGERRPFKNIPT